MHSKRCTLRHIIIILLKARDRETLRAAREKQRVTYKGDSVRLSAIVPSEPLKVRPQGAKTFKVLKEQNCPPRILYATQHASLNAREGNIRHSQRNKR